MDYLKVIATQPFITGTLPAYEIKYPTSTDYPSKQDAAPKILSIGTSGSAIINFFNWHYAKSEMTVVEQDPMVAYLNSKWFGLKEAEGSGLHLSDGLGFLSQRKTAEPKYDFIIVDECYNTADRNAECPRKEYADPMTAAYLRESLSPTGTLAIHVFSLLSQEQIGEQHKLANYEHDLLILYRRYFGGNSCYYVKISTNMILTCTFNPLPPNGMTQHIYHQRFTSANLPENFAVFEDLSGPKVVQDIEAV